MNMEQIAILGIVVFGFIALFHAFNTVRSIKRLAARQGSQRPRRPMTSEASARTMAQGLVREVIEKHETAATQARGSGACGPELTEALEEARLYFRERVDTRCRPVFNQVVDEIILGRVDHSERDQPALDNPRK